MTDQFIAAELSTFNARFGAMKAPASLSQQPVKPAGSQLINLTLSQFSSSESSSSDSEEPDVAPQSATPHLDRLMQMGYRIFPGV